MKFPQIFRSAANEGDPAPALVDPAVTAPEGGAGDPPAAVVTGQEGDPAPEPARREAPPSWALKRISEENAKAREAAARADAAERRAAAAEEMAARLQRREEDPAPAPRAETRRPDTDHQAEVRAEAERMRLYEDSMDVKNRGIAEFGASFGEALSVLNAIGATTDDFVADVLAVDKANAHKILSSLAQDPERAVALTGMSSRQRIAELARMSALSTKPAEPAPAPTPAPATTQRTLSKAPAPAPRVEPSTTRAVDWRSDNATDEEFDRGFNEMMTKRSARR